MRVRDSRATLIRPFGTHYNLSNDNNEQTKAHFFAEVLYTYLENKPFSSQHKLVSRCNASYPGTRLIALLTDYLIGQREACASDPFRAYQ